MYAYIYMYIYIYIYIYAFLPFFIYCHFYYVHVFLENSSIFPRYFFRQLFGITLTTTY